jgi:hypothetical protein
VTFKYMFVTCNDQIKVIGIFINSLCWEHSKSSLLAILKYSINYCQPESPYCVVEH